jgi:NADH-quinone oxidoreductase subunit N
VLAAILTIFLLSLIGSPMTGGFFAKFYVFSASIKANLVWLTLIGVVNSAIGAYYYLRIIVVMYMRESRSEVPVSPIPMGLGFALAICMAATLYLGILPNRILQYAQQSALELLPQQGASTAANAAQAGHSAVVPNR